MVNDSHPPPPDDGSADWQQRALDSATLTMCESLLDASKRRFQGKHAKWKRNARIAYTVKHWEHKRPSFRMSPVSAFAFSVVQTIVPIMTDRRPSFAVRGQTPQDFGFGEQMEKNVQWTWNKIGADKRVKEAIYDAVAVSGSSVFKVDWDAGALNGIGNIRLRVCDPRGIWPDPNCSDFDTAKYVIHEFTATIGELKLQFPDKAKLLTQGGGQKPMQSEDQDDEDAANPGTAGAILSPMDKTPRNPPDSYVTGTANDYTTLTGYELWMLPDETEEYQLEHNEGPGEDNASDLPEMGLRKKYPHGRLITWTGTTLLQDCGDDPVENPYPFRHGMLPFAKFDNYLRPRHFWGISETEMLVPIQETLNEAMSRVLEWIRVMANRRLWVHRDSEVNTENLASIPGQVSRWSGEPHMKPFWEDVPQMPPWIPQIIELLQKHMDVVSGIHDVSRGADPVGIEAAAAINTLQQAAQTRIRLKASNLDDCLKRVGDLIVKTLIEKASSPRLAYIAGDASQGQPAAPGAPAAPPQFYWFSFADERFPQYTTDEQGNAIPHPQAGEPTGQTIATTTPVNSDGSLQADPDGQNQKTIMGDFDVNFDAGSSLPFQRVNRIQAIQQLQAMLDKVGDPNNPLFIAMGKEMDLSDWPNLLQELQKMYADKQQNAGPPPNPPRISLSLNYDKMLELLATTNPALLDQIMKWAQMGPLPEPPAPVAPQIPLNGAQMPQPAGVG